MAKLVVAQDLIEGAYIYCRYHGRTCVELKTVHADSTNDAIRKLIADGTCDADFDSFHYSTKEGAAIAFRRG